MKNTKKIIKAWSTATDIAISHFHGDHIPLGNANPYQLNSNKIANLNPKANIWAKLSHLSPIEKVRAESLSLILENNLIPAEEKHKVYYVFPSQYLMERPITMKKR